MFSMFPGNIIATAGWAESTLPFPAKNGSLFCLFCSELVLKLTAYLVLKRETETVGHSPNLSFELSETKDIHHSFNAFSYTQVDFTDRERCVWGGGGDSCLSPSALIGDETS